MHSARRYESTGVSGAGLRTTVRARRQGRAELEHRDEQRDVPRDDRRDDADRLLAHDRGRAQGAEALLLEDVLAREVGVEVEHHRRAEDLAHQRPGDRRAVLLRDDVSRTPGCGPGSSWLSLAMTSARSDGAIRGHGPRSKACRAAVTARVDVALAGVRDLRDHLFGVRRDDLDHLVLDAGSAHAPSMNSLSLVITSVITPPCRSNLTVLRLSPFELTRDVDVLTGGVPAVDDDLGPRADTWTRRTRGTGRRPRRRPVLSYRPSGMSREAAHPTSGPPAASARDRRATSASRRFPPRGQTTLARMPCLPFSRAVTFARPRKRELRCRVCDGRGRPLQRSRSSRCGRSSRRPTHA